MAVQDCKREESSPAEYVAVICGVTGLVGKELANQLLSTSKWKVYGICRRPEKISTSQNPRYHFIFCDLLNTSETQEKLSSLDDATHIFWVTWASQFPLDTPQICEQNKSMMNNALNAILPRAKALKHISLQTGTKHYVSLQNTCSTKQVCYYDEQCPRADSEYNFYYELEDLLKVKLTGKIAWSVHRPGLIIGSSHSAAFNFMGSLCVYGTICKHLNLPFVFGGKKECWEEMWVDGSDARLVAQQHIWAATNETFYSTYGQAFNAINGSNFTWKEIWPAIGLKFGVTVPENMFYPNFRIAELMADKEQVWKEIVTKNDLVHTQMEEIANSKFLDVLFSCPKILCTRDKADRLGFTTRYHMLDSILHWVDVMRQEKLIP
ncbi:3-oxo-Delta(4,5)-steroid 5-beta-reductase-like [Nicotiana tabacum]|uniref:3-oxo-Delta(4,5)-steroid 5-beta-reductase-like n=1 Tax=Nicotiana tabacum TaxID=4097 RepID=A0A1S3YUM4_TOBAC|nr:PREDICTED: 3-oxo-Delta(4,5)-steroid 5-beta-reductase-like [Nicotiana tabacum]